MSKAAEGSSIPLIMQSDEIIDAVIGHSSSSSHVSSALKSNDEVIVEMIS